MRTHFTYAFLLCSFALWSCDDDGGSSNVSDAETVIDSEPQKTDSTPVEQDTGHDDADQDDAELTDECVDGPYEGVEEICNGKDDNCDGDTDEGFHLGEPCQALGVCAQVEGAVFECDENGGVRCSASPGGSKYPEEIAGPETCDGLDNDCDGTIDNIPAVPCYSGPNGTQDVGECKGGITVCSPEANGSTICKGEQTPQTEVCNGKDDDCNGKTDEDLADVPEICNGKDDNCDGKTDEGFADQLGQACSVEFGPCALYPDPVYECDSEGGIRCSAMRFAQEEVCNNKDDDCDGEIDNSFEGLGEECFPEGECARWPGIKECDPDDEKAELICSTGARGSDYRGLPAEYCNGKDDDCDGETDEDIDMSDFPCYQGAVGTEGVGICHGGHQVCIRGLPQGCEDQQLPQAEECNGLDDDCDGETDEGLDVEEDYTCGFGPCQAVGTRRCVDGHYVGNCTPNELLASPDDNCDGKDDDCDGTPDDDFVEVETTCGDYGECIRTGHIVCESGTPRDTCIPGTPSPDDNCNNKDDDCDGQTDEDYNGQEADYDTVARTTCGVKGVCADPERTDEGRYVPSTCSNGQITPCVPGTKLADDETAEDMICNGLDDDCDGDIDENFITQECGIGLCRNSDSDIKCQHNPLTHEAYVTECVPNPPTLGVLSKKCSDPIVNNADNGECQKPGTEIYYIEEPTVCDGLDNDCDEQVDEHFEKRTKTCGEGVCYKEIRLACENGHLIDELTNTPITGTTEETYCQPLPPNSDKDDTCNRLDDNCNGQIDEDVKTYNQAQDQAQYLGFPLRPNHTNPSFTCASGGTKNTDATQPYMADNGQEYRVVWAENYSCTNGTGETQVTNYNSNSGIYAATLSYNGTVTSKGSIVKGEVPFAYPEIAYNNTEGANGYGLVWIQRDNQESVGSSNLINQVHFARLDANGSLIANSEKALTTGSFDNTLPHIVWNSELQKYGVIWLETHKETVSDNEVRFSFKLKYSLIGANGTATAAQEITNDNAQTIQNPRIIADGNKFVLVYTAKLTKQVGGESKDILDIFFRTLDGSGQLSNATNVTHNDASSDNPAICVRDEGYAIAYTDQTPIQSLGEHGEAVYSIQDELYFALLNSNGQLQGTSTRINTTTSPMKKASAPSLVKTNGGFGLAWIDTSLTDATNENNHAVRFQHLNADGSLFDAPYNVSYNDKEVSLYENDCYSPQILWRSQGATDQFTLIWQGNIDHKRSGSKEIYYNVGSMGCTPGTTTSNP